MSPLDQRLSRLFMVASLLILGYWAYLGLAWVWDWYQDSGGYTTQWWPDLGRFLWRNLSIVVAVYGIACLQASGLAELKYGKNFLLAFILALVLTPPGMMIAYGHRR